VYVFPFWILVVNLPTVVTVFPPWTLPIFATVPSAKNVQKGRVIDLFHAHGTAYIIFKHFNPIRTEPGVTAIQAIDKWGFKKISLLSFAFHLPSSSRVSLLRYRRTASVASWSKGLPY
jgi:hypothetical protein